MADFAWVTHAAGPRKGTRKYVNLDKVTDMVRNHGADVTAIFLDSTAGRATSEEETRQYDERLVLCVEAPEQILLKQRI